MANINYDEVKTYANADRGYKRVVDITLQAAGIASLVFPETDLPVYTNIMVPEGIRLMRAFKPSSINIFNADAVDCSRWWNKLKLAYGGELENIKFMVTGIKDNWKPNMEIITPVVKEVVSKLAGKKPLVFYVRPTENSIVIKSVTQSIPDGPKVTHTFEIEFVGDWNWRHACGKLLADVLPDQFCNLRKVNMVFGFTCNTCVERVFDSMGWTFPESRMANTLWSFGGADDLFFDSYATTRQYYNEFTIGATNTKVRYFFQERMILAAIHDPNYVTLAGVGPDCFGC